MECQLAPEAPQGVPFEWDSEKAASNLAKHGVSFEEASTVFGDRLAATVLDQEHSGDEERWLTTGLSLQRRVVIVWHTDRGCTVRIIGRGRPHRMSGGSMSQENNDRQDEMKPEYDIRGGERGKYFERYMQASTITVTFEESTLIVPRSTASASSVGSITKAAVYPPAIPSPEIQGIEAAA